MLPLGTSNDSFERVGDDRVAAIVATALLGLPSKAADEAITRALAAVGLQRGVDRAFYYQLDDKAGLLTLTHEWHAPGDARDESRPQVRAPAAGPVARAAGRQPAPGRRRAHPAHAQVSQPVGRAAGRCRRRSRAGDVAGRGRGGADRRRRLRRRGRIRVGTGRRRSAADRRPGRRARRGAGARRERTARQRGALPRDVRRIAAGHLPGRRVRRLPVPEPGRPAHRGPDRTRRRAGGMDKRPAPRRSRTRHPQCGPRRSRPAAPTRGPCTASCTRTATCVRRGARGADRAGPAARAAFLGLLEDVTDRVRAEQERQDMLARTEAARAEAEAARQEAEAARADVDEHLVAHLGRVHRASTTTAATPTPTTARWPSAGCRASS